MTRVVIKKIAELIVVLFLVSLGTFGLVSLIPGDPAVAALGPGRAVEEYEAKRLELGLHKGFFERYWDWISSALSGDLGKSMVLGDPGARRSGNARPASRRLAVSGVGLALNV